MCKKKICVLLIALSLLLVGCSAASKNDGEKAKGALMKSINPAPVEISYRDKDKSIAFQVRKDVKDFDEVYDVAIIEGDKDVVVSYKVRHLYRFNMKKIEKKITDFLHEKYPDNQFIVSSDYKIFLETIRLKEDLETNNISADDAKKRLDKIIKLQKEMT